MAPNPATSERITARDMMAVAKVDWNKLAARSGFGATAKAHYESLVHCNRPNDTTMTRQSKTETYDRFTSRHPSDLEDGEIGAGSRL
ncbi:hypothetical protein SAMD00023353_0103790 [Rosellinia necatrix]|uniref:Uncharacterized protein n=1 Tax=Rosellinia necatrix TaxID=77044 RepID=A0A1S8A4V4_ROSNE|nr:hypothetical protein SAMD00023353_0103790 [Rosellinia necatrix]